MYNGASRWGQAFDRWRLAVFSFWCTWLYKGVTCFVFLLSFPLSLPFDLTLSYWVYVCCFVLLYFGCYVMLCYVMLCYVMLCYVMLCYVMFYVWKKKLITKEELWDKVAVFFFYSNILEWWYIPIGGRTQTFQNCLWNQSISEIMVSQPESQLGWRVIFTFHKLPVTISQIT